LPSLSNDGPTLDVIYLLPDIGLSLDTSPVLHSQILDWIRVQTDHGIRVGVVAIVDDRELSRSTVEPVLVSVGVPHIIVQSGHIVSTLTRSARAIRTLRREYDCNNVYVRGFWGALAHFMAFPFGGPPLVYDFRGDGVAEAAYRGTGRVRRWIIKRLMRFSVHRAANITGVSRGAAKVLAEQYGQENVAIIPSCVDLERNEFDPEIRGTIRNQLGLNQAEVVIAYAGGISRYQQITEMLGAWRELNDEGEIRFLLLLSGAPSPDGSLPEQNTAPPGTIIKYGLSRAEVATHLMAADIGFMLRIAHPLNMVASPVKFAEYLSAGLAVLTSPGLGDVSSLVTDRALGALADPNDHASIVDECLKLMEAIRSDPSAVRNRSIDAARETLDWKVYLHTWRDLLKISDPARVPNEGATLDKS